MPHQITVLPQNVNIAAKDGDALLTVLTKAGLVVDAPCGGEGKCGKCRVLIDGKETLACQTAIYGNMTVTLMHTELKSILTCGITPFHRQMPARDGYALAFDIGTTTVVGYLLSGTQELACASTGNPQVAFGADVISRIRQAIQGQQPLLTDSIRECLENLTRKLCDQAGVLPGQVGMVSLVGNPAMQQLFLGHSLENLAKVPFAPVLTRAKTVPAWEIIPLWEHAQLLIVPDIAGFVGADTVACVLAIGMEEAEETALLVDIGTNGEMVMGNRHRLVACSTAAGPALEGAGIRFGMRGTQGAIDHVWVENGAVRCSVIGGGTARGICGSGLVDAVAVALESGWLNARGKILTSDGLIQLCDGISLNQEDIRQLQLAKGAIAAGIEMLAQTLGICLEEIETVYLAGAFGTYMDPASACIIGLLPRELKDRIKGVGNAASSGAKLLACSEEALAQAGKIAAQTTPVELSALPGFARCFAKNMRF